MTFKQFFTVWTEEFLAWLTAKFNSIDIDLTPVEEKVDEVSDKIDDIKDTFDADMALQLQGIIGEGEESVEGNSQTEGEIERLRTLQESYDALAGNSSAIAFETEVQAGKAAIIDAIEDKGGTASMAMSLTGLAQAIDSINYPTLATLYAIGIPSSPNVTLVDLGGIGTYTGVNFSNVFSNHPYIETLRNVPYSPNLSVISSLLRDCTGLKYADISGIGQAVIVGSAGDAFRNCPLLQTLNIIGISFSGVTVFSNTFFGCTSLQSLVGDKTYEKVVENNIKVFDGVNINMNAVSGLPLNRASLRATINGLADRTGQSALTLTIGAVNIAKLSAEDIAVATNKNWTIA